jgi:diaminopimelate epimerase
VFPNRTNVDFVRVLNEKTVIMRTFERGCGPTLACGTGACGAAVACVLNKKTGRSVDVNIALGTLHIDWAEDNHVYMTGPAEIVFEGEIGF